MTPDERLAGPLLKLNRAKFHIQNLDAAIGEFFATNPYGISCNIDRKPGYRINYLSKVDPVPPIVSVLIGDALYNLRAALDHLAQQLYFVGTGTDTTADHVSYPIVKDAATYNAEVARKVKGMRQDAIDFIDATKPYGGGNDVLWQIHKLNIIDKHRVLLACGSAPAAISIDITQWANEFFAQQGAPLVPSLHAGLALNKPKCPLEKGDEITVEPIGSHPDKQRGFAFFVALHEPAVIEPQPLMLVLTKFADTVDGILNRARPLLV